MIIAGSSSRSLVVPRERFQGKLTIAKVKVQVQNSWLPVRLAGFPSGVYFISALSGHKGFAALKKLFWKCCCTVGLVLVFFMEELKSASTHTHARTDLRTHTHSHCGWCFQLPVFSMRISSDVKATHASPCRGRATIRARSSDFCCIAITSSHRIAKSLP